MKIDKKNVERLFKHLNNHRSLAAKLKGDSQAKDLIEAEIRGIELALLVLGIEAK